MKKVQPHIVFVFPPAATFADENLSTCFNYSLGSAYIISYLEQQGFNARPFLTNEPASITTCTRRILAEKPRAVGFTAYDNNYHLCVLIAAAIKETNSKIITIFGGPTASVQDETVLQNNPAVDICVRYEGEETCLELLSLLEDMNFDLKRASACFERIKGITYRAGDRIVKNPARDIFLAHKNTPDFLDKYPSPYLSGVMNSAKPGIITARGCNQHCVYCNCAIMSKRIIITHSTNRVIEEMAYISKKFGHLNEGNVVIFDDAFTLLPDRAHQICRQIIENKIKISLGCITRCDTVNEELLNLMKEAGFKAIGFALESSTPHILRKIGKVRHPNTRVDPHFTKEQEFVAAFKKYTAYAKKIGINFVFASIMIGLPGETLKEGQNTVDVIRSLEEKIDYYSHNFLNIYAGTPIFYNYKKFGINLEKSENQVHFNTIHAYDPLKVTPAAKSSLETESIMKDKSSLKCLGLLPSKKSKLDFFNKIILLADVITGELPHWLQRYLAINGSFIQIYTNRDQAKQYHKNNIHTLRKYLSPTNSYTEFYQTVKEDGVTILNPIRSIILNREYGIPIELIKTASGLSSSPKTNPLHTICIDRDIEDVLRLHQVLSGWAQKEPTVQALAESPLFPYFNSLCRWQKGAANCHTLEIIIVDADYNVKTCWNGKSLGKVGMPFPAIVANLKKNQRSTETKRACRNCIKQAVCTKCIFPEPLSANQYCNLKRDLKNQDAIELIRTFDSFKEF